MIKSLYEEKLKEAQREFAQRLSQILTNHYNHIITTYSGWNRYPRKVKKMLKRENWWGLKDKNILGPGEIKVKFNV